MTVAQVAVGLLRQQTVPDDRIVGVVTEAGTAANIIPDASRGHGSSDRPRWRDWPNSSRTCSAASR